MSKENSVKDPVGWKIKKYIDIVLKKCKFKMTYSRKIDILVKKGLKIGKNVILDGRAIIDQNFCHLISIGDNSVICAGAVLMAHDSTIFSFTGDHGRAGKVEIKENCIISVNAIVLPGVTIGPNVLVAAGSVVNKDIPPDSCVAGVPARVYGKFSDFISLNKENINKSEYVFRALHNIDDPEELQKEKKKMIEEAKKRDIYFKVFKNEAQKKDACTRTKPFDLQ